MNCTGVSQRFSHYAIATSTNAKCPTSAKPTGGPQRPAEVDWLLFALRNSFDVVVSENISLWCFVSNILFLFLNLCCPNCWDFQWSLKDKMIRSRENDLLKHHLPLQMSKRTEPNKKDIVRHGFHMNIYEWNCWMVFWMNMRTHEKLLNELSRNPKVVMPHRLLQRTASKKNKLQQSSGSNKNFSHVQEPNKRARIDDSDGKEIDTSQN